METKLTVWSSVDGFDVSMSSKTIPRTLVKFVEKPLLLSCVYFITMENLPLSAGVPVKFAGLELCGSDWIPRRTDCVPANCAKSTAEHIYEGEIFLP